eukprot:s1077_g1.t1
MQKLATLIQVKDHEVKSHTPRSFGSLLPAEQKWDSQLMVSNEALRIAQDPVFLPPAKKAKTIRKTPLEIRTFTPDDIIPVVMAAYGNQHKFNIDLRKEKGCMMHFLADERFGVRYLHPTEIAQLHGVTSRYFAQRNFTDAWRFLGNQITPFHAMIVLTGACAIIPSIQPTPKLKDVYDTWEFQRLKNQNAFLTMGKAGYVLRHMNYDDDLTSCQHANLDRMLKRHATEMLPANQWWELDGFHDMPAVELMQSDDVQRENVHSEQLPMLQALSPVSTEKDPSEITETMPFRITIKATLHLPARNIAFWVASNVQPSQLPTLWNVPCEVTYQDGEIHMYPQDTATLNLEHSTVTFLLKSLCDENSRRLLSKAFADAFDKDTLHALGRSITVCHDAETQILFAPAEFGTPLHITAFATCLATVLTRTMLDALQASDGILVRIKWQSRTLWTGHIDPAIHAESLTQALMYTLSPVMKLRGVRLIHGAKQFASGPIHQCINPNKTSSEVKLHVSYELCGGGGPTSTKGQLKQQVSNSVAAWMLENGQELSWINSNLEEIIDSIGINRVPIVQQPAGNRRDSQLHQLLIDSAIKLPEIPKKIQNRQNT